METALGMTRRTHGAASGRAARPPRAWRAPVLRFAFGVAVVAGLWITVAPTDGEGRWVQLALAALAVAGLVASGRWPVLAVAVTGTATGVAVLLGLTADPFVLTGFTVFALAEQRGSRRFPWWMVAGVAVLLISSAGLSAEGVEERFRGLLLSAVVLSASWVLGVRTRQARVEAAARSRAEERFRLARDVHDVLSHSLGTIGVRAGVAAHVTSLDEADLRVALRDIEQGARESLAELKTLLHRERAGSSDAPEGLTPPSAQLTTFLAHAVEHAERAGLRTRLDLFGAIDDLPAPVRVTVHRVTQEAVTNALRHAAASSLVVSVRISADRVDVEVQDDGRGAPTGVREGHGLTGMRERVALVGGVLDIAADARGFTVTVSLPLNGTRAGGGS
ncbi:sensor histidine kinase [Leifsonia sp. ALI-44-B]|uniref:sensor histidine kinase n=1 Tax=Leifsonia sp. ALI-44-B TaxID=1933776 RepID=UPI0009FA8BC1|nr:sensor histidine kinase [Leifsonia sp. ALI-44-B]